MRLLVVVACCTMLVIALCIIMSREFKISMSAIEVDHKGFTCLCINKSCIVLYNKSKGAIRLVNVEESNIYKEYILSETPIECYRGFIYCTYMCFGKKFYAIYKCEGIELKKIIEDTLAIDDWYDNMFYGVGEAGDVWFYNRISDDSSKHRIIIRDGVRKKNVINDFMVNITHVGGDDYRYYVWPCKNAIIAKNDNEIHKYDVYSGEHTRYVSYNERIHHFGIDWPYYDVAYVEIAGYIIALDEHLNEVMKVAVDEEYERCDVFGIVRNEHGMLVVGKWEIYYYKDERKVKIIYKRRPTMRPKVEFYGDRALILDGNGNIVEINTRFRILTFMNLSGEKGIKCYRR